MSPALSIRVFIIALSLSVGACSSVPKRDEPSPRHTAVAADTALKMIGKPYRYGGKTPQGFDCSGLVHYSFQHAGVPVPRATDQLKHAGRRVPKRDLRKGDLLFFDQEGKRSSHVGIYVGDDVFVHAPSSGKKVRRDRLADPYWRKHFVDARRL